VAANNTLRISSNGQTKEGDDPESFVFLPLFFSI